MCRLPFDVVSWTCSFRHGLPSHPPGYGAKHEARHTVAATGNPALRTEIMTRCAKVDSTVIGPLAGDGTVCRPPQPLGCMQSACGWQGNLRWCTFLRSTSCLVVLIYVVDIDKLRSHKQSGSNLAGPIICDGMRLRHVANAPSLTVRYCVSAARS